MEERKGRGDLLLSHLKSTNLDLDVFFLLFER